MKRALGLLVLSLLAGVLVAQDGSASLRDRVRALRAEIEARTPSPSADAVMRRSYEVGALLAVQRASRDPGRDLATSRMPAPEAEEWPEPHPVWAQETLLEFVTGTAGPDAEVELRSGLLSVSGPREIHRRIERLLARLAERTHERLVVEIEIVPSRDGDDAAWAENRALSPRAVLGRASVPCANGIEQAYSAVQERRYIFDYDEESAREAGMGKPRTATFTEGLSGDVLVCLDPRGGGVLAHMRIHWQRLASESRMAETQHGPVTLPALDAVRLRTSTWLPFDRPVLVATCMRGMTPCHVIVRVRAAG